MKHHKVKGAHLGKLNVEQKVDKRRTACYVQYKQCIYTDIHASSMIYCKPYSVMC